ncbi:MAG: MarR family winged helix-turn-helix transcriptional regulator [Sciscionella sp.]
MSGRSQEAPGSSSAQLARRVQVSAQNMHILVSVLEKKGWVRRTPHPELGRVRQITLTDEGSRLTDRCSAHAFALADDLVTGLTPGQIEKFARLLRHAERNLEQRHA